MLDFNKVFLLFEDRINKNRNFLFINPIKKLKANNKEELNILFEKIEYYKNKGKYIAGYFPYDAMGEMVGGAPRGSPDNDPVCRGTNEPICRGTTGGGPYRSELYVFDKVIRLSNEELDDYFKNIKLNSYIYDFNPRISKGEYLEKLKKLKKYIKDGETYQTNFTFLSDFKFTEEPINLYKSLREKQKVEYGAFLNLDDKIVISLSPELFVQKNNDILMSKPMKGTLKRDNPDFDEENIKKMKNDKKMISENLMIVDLIRNDFTKISRPKTVKVENIFEVLKYKTLYQMISTVKSEIDKDIKFNKVMKALFPCGSITGAPKIRTMQIIKELESDKRGIYTGAIGFITPNNDFIFNIAIRTITIMNPNLIDHVRVGLAPTPQSYSATIGIGGGILHDSNNEDEWEEALLKSKFLRDLNEDLIIIETILEKDGKLEHEKEHIDRMNKSAKCFGISKTRIRKVRVAPRGNPPHEKYGNPPHETPEITSSPLPKITISPIKINHNSIFRRHKTNQRELYNTEYEKIKSKFIDIIFFNQDGNLAEASRNNIYIEINNKIYTPFVKDGALPGIIRQKLIDENKVIEKTINMDLFKKAEKIYLSNSVNGFLEVRAQRSRGSKF